MNSSSPDKFKIPIFEYGNATDLHTVISQSDTLFIGVN